MDEQALFIAVAQESHNFFVFTSEFCQLAATSSLDDQTLTTLF